ncbi:uncharacterized protein FIBRA_06772 [Fibroporia radiculosa]|uniref:NADP-dependent oxidoreductase domain-containing protein n=1 Tax=Fibroporia radiculosa TaxID=599839 RepID=J4IBF9_9APHY|nr:uncharacterized protein FIBRA_06772 [Fibroporia radiculosa]CCM04591.1 predicted protein [Fibroporia radiculosa]
MAVLSLFRRYSQQAFNQTSRAAMSSPTLTLNDGNTIPWLGFGTGTALYGKDAENAVRTAIDNGVIHLDGAQVYRNEESLGAAIAASGKPRSSLYITTKLEKVPAGQTVHDTLVVSLKKLQVDYVDLFLIHFPINHEQPLSTLWKQVEDVQKEGLARSIGVSNFRVKDFEAILPEATVIPAVNQIEYHPYVFKADQPVIEYMKAKNILPTSFGGLSPIVRFKGGPVDPVLTSIAERLSKTVGKTVTEGQVLQLWLKTKGIPAITTTSKAERIHEYLAVQSLPNLTAEDVAAIEEAGSTVHHRQFAKFFDD